MQPAPGMHNEDVAAAFDEMAELLAIGGENPFRIRAYQRAAQVIRSLPRPLAELHGTEEFDALPGIGADLAGKIDELLRTGKLRALEQVRRKVPAGLRELLRLPGLGPTRVRGWRGAARQPGQAITAHSPGRHAGSGRCAAQYAEPLRAHHAVDQGLAGATEKDMYDRARPAPGLRRSCAKDRGEIDCRGTRLPERWNSGTCSGDRMPTRMRAQMGASRWCRMARRAGVAG